MSNIDTSKWKEFRLDELFTSINGDVDIKKEHINGEGECVVTAGETNRGILGKSDIEARVIEPNTLTVDMFGYCAYRDMQYKLVTHARVFSLIPKIKIETNEIGLWYETMLSKLLKDFSYDNMCSWSKIRSLKIKLPITEEVEEIDWDFMDKSMRALEKVVIADVVKYKDRVIKATKEIVNVNKIG